MSLIDKVNDLATRIATEFKSLLTRLSPGAVGATFDGNGAVIAAGTRIDIACPFAGTVTSWTGLADVSTSTVINVYKASFANAPPTVTDKITASAPPTISAAVKATSSTLTGWSTTVNAGDVFTFIIDSNDNAKRLSAGLVIRR